MGRGEEVYNAFYRAFSSLSNADRDAFRRQYPEPVEWGGFYNRIVDRPWRDACQGEPVTPGKGAVLTELLVSRADQTTKLELKDGTELTAYNTTWGRDLGEEWEHLFINASPQITGMEVYFVRADEIARVIDPASSAVLYELP